MLIVRPVTFADLTALEQLAVVAGGSMSTLPANRDHLSEMIAATQQSLRSEPQHPGGETYHFVLEDTQSHEIIGIAGINSSVGIESPFYSYRIEQVVHASSDLQIHNRIPALHLCQDHTGSSSLCSLFLAPKHRTTDNINLLSRSRMLFMASHRQRFADCTLVELQGIQDDNHKSPFWEAIGRHFFSMDFSQANYLTGIQNKSFIANLMPHYPVYVPLLPESAQAVIGKPRPDISPIVELLEAEGFKHGGYIDIFDAGPTLELRTDRIRSLSDSQQLTANCSGQDSQDAAMALVCNTELKEFRCVLTKLDINTSQLNNAAAELLKVSSGDPLRAHLLTP